MTTNNSTVRIDKLLTPLGQLISIIVVIAGASLGLLAKLHDIESRLLRIELVSVSDRWYARDQIVWAYALGAANEDLIVPDPQKIIRDRVKALE